PYELAGLELEGSGSPFAPMSALNQLRREAVQQLQAIQSQHRSAPVVDPMAALAGITMSPDARGAAPELHLVVRTPEDLEAALTLAPASSSLEYLDLDGLRPSYEGIESSGIAAGVASPRVLKPGEERIPQFLLALEGAILVRSRGLLQTMPAVEHPPLIGDF